MIEQAWWTILAGITLYLGIMLALAVQAGRLP